MQTVNDAHCRFFTRARLRFGRLVLWSLFPLLFANSPATAASVCYDETSATQIADLSMAGNGLEYEDGLKLMAIIKDVASANCIIVDHYPSAQEDKVIEFGCHLLSGTARLGNGEPQTFYWTKCPAINE